MGFVYQTVCHEIMAKMQMVAAGDVIRHHVARSYADD